MRPMYGKQKPLHSRPGQLHTVLSQAKSTQHLEKVREGFLAKAAPVPSTVPNTWNVLASTSFFFFFFSRDPEGLLVKQSKERIVHNPDTGVSTSDNRCNECSNIKDIYGEKVG
jgi:hypothetical protein